MISEKKADKEEEIFAQMQKTKTSLMNNSKWRRLFKAVKESGCSVEKARYKPLTEENELCKIVLEREAGTDEYTKDGVGIGCMNEIAGPVRFRKIEFILIEFSTAEDMKKFLKVLNSYGKFEYTAEKVNVLKVLGYC